MIRLLLFSFCLAELAAGQQLRVKSANARSVQLEWTGATGPVTVERTSGITVQKTPATDPSSYEDKTIDAFATYRYRVSAGGKSSNEVIVGPPPAGVMNAAPLPKDADPGKFGQASAMALDENGDPVIAFEWVDPNGDGDFSDNEVRVVHWSRATYRWLPSVRAMVVGDISNQNLNPISIGCDRKTGLLAVVTPVGDKSASMVVSKDGGATWNATQIPGITDQIYATALAIMDGKIHLVADLRRRPRALSFGAGRRYLVLEDPTAAVQLRMEAAAERQREPGDRFFRESRDRLVREPGRRRRPSL